MRIVLCYPVKPHHVDQIANAAPDAQIIDAGQERVAAELLSADIFCGHAKVPVDWDAVVAGKRLRWIQSSAAGMDHCLVPSVIDSDIHVTSASAVLADQVAEHAIALLTGWCRSMPVFFDAQQKKEFIRRPTKDLTRSTVGIVGLGGVGRRLAEILAQFKTRILATDLFPTDKPDTVESLWPADRLDDMLAICDIVLLCLPLNEMTRGLFNSDRLARMKQGALLANMARGPLVDHVDLVATLQSGHLGGVVCDVTEPEPLPASSPLWEMSNVTITPHVAGQSAWRIDNMTRLFCENLRRWQAKERLINYLDDKRLGFPKREPGTTLWTDVEQQILS